MLIRIAIRSGYFYHRARLEDAPVREFEIGDELADDVGVRGFDEEVEEVARGICPPVLHDDALFRRAGTEFAETGAALLAHVGASGGASLGAVPERYHVQTCVRHQRRLLRMLAASIPQPLSCVFGS